MVSPLPFITNPLKNALYLNQSRKSLTSNLVIDANTSNIASNE